MKILRKNQLALLVISLMLITAGYLNYSSTIAGNPEEASANVVNNIDLASIGDAKLVNSNVVEENTNTLQDTSYDITNEENKNANANVSNNNYFTTSKLERNVMYSQMIERYQGILESTNAYADQKAIAQEQIDNINNTQNAIMITENLLTTKGFENNIIFVNGESISIIIGKENLTQDEIAQIQNIVSREFNADLNNIHISLK